MVGENKRTCSGCSQCKQRTDLQHYLTKMPKSCVAVDCHNHNLMGAEKISFSIFPCREKFPNRWKKWVNAVSRRNEDGTQWEPARYAYLCEDHFISGAVIDKNVNNRYR